jgi:hypothetical protein
LKGIGGSITNADVLMSLAYKDFDGSFDPVSACAPSSPSLLSLSPRPYSWSKKIMQFRQVPPQLEGIGLGHLGPLAVSAPALPVANSAEQNTATAKSGMPEGGVENALSGQPSAEQNASVRQLFADLIGRSKKGQRRTSVRRVRAEDSHRAFGRSEIAEWRGIYRPTVESAIAQMEANRKKWRARESTPPPSPEAVGAGDEKVGVVTSGGSNSVTDTEDASTVSTMGDDNGASADHFESPGGAEAQEVLAEWREEEEGVADGTAEEEIDS